MMRGAGMIGLISLVLLACNKEPLPDLPEDNTPYYSISGLMGEDSVNLFVGQEGITFAQGQTQVNGIPAFFGQISSPAENLTFKMTLTRPERPVGAEGPQVIDQYTLGYLVHQAGCRDFTFSPVMDQGNYLLIKNEDESFVPAESINFQQFGMYPIVMKFTDVGQNSFTVPVNYGFEQNQLNPKFIVYNSPDTVSFAAINQDGSHQWLVDGSTVSNSALFSMSSLSDGIHEVQHLITDEYGNIASFESLIRVTDYLLDWQMQIGNCGDINPSNFGKVIVTVDKDGEQFSSEFVTDNLDHVFSATNVAYVSTDNSGEPNRAVFDFFFDAELKNATQTESLSLNSMTGTFNVGL